jgi:hypothetical protein
MTSRASGNRSAMVSTAARWSKPTATTTGAPRRIKVDNAWTRWLSLVISTS